MNSIKITQDHIRAAQQKAEIAMARDGYNGYRRAMEHFNNAVRFDQMYPEYLDNPRLAVENEEFKVLRLYWLQHNMTISNVRAYLRDLVGNGLEQNHEALAASEAMTASADSKDAANV